MTASPQVAVLERSYLEQVNRERAISQDAPASALLTSMLRLDLEFSRRGADDIAVVASVSDPGGERRTISVYASAKEPDKLSDSLLSAVLKKLDLQQPAVAYERATEGQLLVDEAVFECESHHYEQSLALTEAAIALAPDEPSLWPATCWLLAEQGRQHIWPGSPFLSWRSARLIPSQEYTLGGAYLLRAIDVLTRIERYEKDHGHIRITDSTAEHSLEKYAVEIRKLVDMMRNGAARTPGPMTC